MSGSIFIGVENRNEFFTQHYLAAVLSGDLKPVLKQWRDAASADDTDVSRTPPSALSALQAEWFRNRQALLKASGEARIERHLALQGPVLDALGYGSQLAYSFATLPSGALPLMGALKRNDGSPLLWIVPVPHVSEDGTLAAYFGAAPDSTADATRPSRPPSSRPPASGDSKRSPDSKQPRDSKPPRASNPFGARLDAARADAPDLPAALTPHHVEDAITEAFALEEPPRFILVVGVDDIFLAERAKWSEQRLLAFDLNEVLGRRQSDTLDITAALLHRESLAPSDASEGGTPLIDTLDDKSHKHAFGVSEDLKYALQACIEKLGNAAIRYHREVKKQKAFDQAIDASQLALECLRTMYRLLFLFYIEARPELGYAPMGEDAYALGYSLERLRELEQLDLDTEEAKRGHYIHRSLRLLFSMIYNGCAPEKQSALPLHADATDSLHGVFSLAPLRSHLFDPARTPFLDGGSYKSDRGVMFDNETLREVIELMSLTRPASQRKSQGRDRRRGRISYATLGINQIGAVYEALLSFRGFFAETDLFEVKKAKDDHDVLDTAYFVPESDLDEYTEAERVYEDANTLKRYRKGEFVYRLAGRDRQTSASYYTPEVLTRTVVKYALKELLQDEHGKPKLTADEILHVTVCEPAMGSAAFLNEAVNQLAEAYLQAKQRERDERIPLDRYAFERQRVKMFMADNNVFGVDLNPIAVELAEVSLWLNTIHESPVGEPGFVPWFGGQLACGNSLVGARRQVFARADVSAGKSGKDNNWLDTPPTRVPLGETRPADSVYHFFLGDRAMASYARGSEGKPIAAMAKDELATIDAWRKDFCAPLDDDDHTLLIELSDTVDRLWQKHAALLERIRIRTTDAIPIYGRAIPDGAAPPTTTAYKDAVWQQEMQSEGVYASSPYRRLKLVMDYWSALWFWPIERADDLPSREQFLGDLQNILDTHVLRRAPQEGEDQMELFAPTTPEDDRQLLMDDKIVNVDDLVARHPHLRVVEELAKRHRFLHWELEFADVFRDRGGFDIMLGNPPWLPVTWREADMLGDAKPAFVLKKLSAKKTSERREKTLDEYNLRSTYLRAHEAAGGMSSYLGAATNYPLLRGVKTNLYKCFLPLAWDWTSPRGTAGLLHPEKVYDEPKGGGLREALYPRLRRHYQFSNEMELFPEVHHQLKYSINIYGPAQAAPAFQHIANLFTPATIEASLAHAGRGPVPGLKDDDGNWGTDGHRDRVLNVDHDALALFAKLYDDADTPALRARLPALHSRQMLPVLEKISRAKRVGDLERWMASDIFHESRSVSDGILQKETVFPTSAADFVMTGPHFFVGNPLYKSPRSTCTQNSHYDVLDLCEQPSDYLQRANYQPGAESSYRSAIPRLAWDRESPITALSRIVVPNMIGPAGERTLQPAVVPAGPTHVHTVNSHAFGNTTDLLRVAAAWSSIPLDFFVKSTGSGHFQPNLARTTAVPARHLTELAARVLLLNCLTSHYATLWRDAFDPAFTTDTWAKGDSGKGDSGNTDPRLAPTRFTTLAPEWTWDTPLRSDYERRQALVEIDVLAAMGLGLTLEELITIYRAQFYVMRGYEADTWYDRNGRIVFTNSKGLVGVGLPRTTKKGDPTPAWNDVKDMTTGTVAHQITDDTQPGGPIERTITYVPPFDRCNRETDYAITWAHFEARFAAQGK